MFLHRIALSVCIVALTAACGDKDDADTAAATTSDASGTTTEATGSDGGGSDGATGDDGADSSGGSDGSGGSMDDGGSSEDGGSGGSMDDGGSSEDGSSDGTMDDGGSSDDGGSDGTTDTGGDGDEGGDDSGGTTGSGSSGSGSSGSGSGGTTGGGSGSSSRDTDGDGQPDGDELAQGTDPLDYYDRAYTGGYNVASCGTSIPSGTAPSGSSTYQVGDIVENFQFTDIHGEDVDLYSFCDNHVMLVFSAMWCGNCATSARSAQSTQNTYAADGFQYIEILVESRSGSTLSSTDASTWATTYGLTTVPVLDDSAKTHHPYYETNSSYPTYVHLEAGTMEVLSVDSGVSSPSGWL